MSASGNNVVLNFATPQFTNLQSIAGTAMVPEHIWKSVSSPATFADPSPVGTGPMKLGSFTPQGFTLIKNPSYWQASQVQVPKVFFPVYTSNTSALSALFSGHIDWTGNYIPGLQHSFISTNPEFHHHWEAPGGTNSLVPNLNKWPTNQLPVRQAISAAINRQLLASEGESGLENPVLNATGLTPQLFDAWSGPVASMTVLRSGQRGRRGADPAEGRLHQGIGRLLRQGRQEGLDHDHEPVRLHRLRPGRLPRRAAVEGGRDRRQLPGPVGGRVERRRRLG